LILVGYLVAGADAVAEAAALFSSEIAFSSAGWNISVYFTNVML
jgi:hypothetical protein